MTMTAASFDLDELRATARAMLSDVSGAAAVRRAHDSGADVEAALWSQMAALGWLAAPTPEAYGGLALGPSALAILYEEMGRSVAPVFAPAPFLAAEAIAAAGENALKQEWLPRIAAGEARIAVAASWRAPLLADARGRLSGALPHIIGMHADAVLAPIRAGGVNILGLISTATNGVTLTPTPGADMTRELGAASFDNAAYEPLPLTPHQWGEFQNHASLALACDSLGGAEAILDLTIAYMKTREQFDRPIGSFQALEHRAATWKVLLEATRALVQSAVRKCDAGEGDREAVSACAKFYACDAYAAIAGDSVQLHGGIGFTWEHECHLYLKRAKFNQMLFGAAEEHMERVATLAIERGASR